MPSGRPPGRRRRDRRGRGLRGALLAAGTGDPRLDSAFRLPAPLPDALTRSERFDETVRMAVEELEIRWAAELSDVEFVVEDVPPVGPESVPPATVEPVPLTGSSPAAGRGRDRRPAVVVVYRRPLEARSHGPADLAELVFDVLVHELADLLGRTPEEIDPEGHGGADG